jgi:hypothetical protein
MRGGLAETVGACYREDMNSGEGLRAYAAAGKAADASERAKKASQIAGSKASTTHDQVASLVKSHAKAGEAHLRAAAAHEKSGTYSIGHDAEYHAAQASEHEHRAAWHAEAAGSAWDEEKHPRDENGKFA